MNIKHICFDLDGVLINSLELMESSWVEAAQKYKLDINFNSYKKHIGIPFFDILYKLGIEESYWEKIKKTYDEISTTEINNIKKYEGVDNLLDYLSSKEISSRPLNVWEKAISNRSRCLSSFTIIVRAKI